METTAVKMCAPDDPRADIPTYVAVCRECGGWQVLSRADREDDESRRYHKRLAEECIDSNADLKKMRFADIDAHACGCLDRLRAEQKAKRAAERAKRRATRFVS